MSRVRLTVTTEDEAVFDLEVNDELEVETLVALCEIETGIPTNSFRLIHNGRFLQDPKESLVSAGVGDGDFLFLYRLSDDSCAPVSATDSAESETAPREAPPDVTLRLRNDAASESSRAENDAEFHRLAPERKQRLVEEAATLREALLSRPEEMEVLKERNPLLAEALMTGDAISFAAAIHDLRQQHNDSLQHPFSGRRNLLDPRVQEMIAEEIRQKNVEANRAAALEFSPESFAKVTMLFVPVRVNGHPVKAFVDTGAQSTMINLPCAKRCNLMHLLDRRYAGVAYGVGTQRILGRVHASSLQIGREFLDAAFNVVENEPLEMMLGLDVLSRHRCLVDLDRRCLVVGGPGGAGIEFLAADELPDLSGVARKDERPEELQDEAAATAAPPRDADFVALARALEGMTSGGREGEEGGEKGGEVAKEEERVDQDNLESLVKMGFDRGLAAAELILQGGDVNQAVASLLAKSLSFSS